MFKLGIIGGGAMGAALLEGVLKANLLTAEQIYLFEIDPGKRDDLQNRTGCQVTTGLKELTAETQTVILAVKPQVITNLLKELTPLVDRNHLLISIVAGISLESLESQLPKARFVRVMPNTPARIGRGVAVYASGHNATGVDAEKVAAIFGCVGIALQLPEHLFDAVTALSGSGPAYVCKFIGALVDAGVMLGLSRQDAVVMATETVAGTAELLKSTQEHPAKLMNDVTSPGGTTAAALFELEKAAFNAAIMKAVAAAAYRSKELTKLTGE